MKFIIATFAVMSLLTCTAIPFAYFWGGVTFEKYKQVLFLASIAWFVFSTLWSTKRSN